MTAARQELVEEATTYLNRYQSEDVALLAQRFPRGQQSLVVDLSDVYRFDESLAEDIRAHPEQFREVFERALTNVDLPVDASLEAAGVRFGNVATDADTYDVGEYGRLQVGDLVGVRGQVNKRSAKREQMLEACYECARCGTPTVVSLDAPPYEPHECQGCERQGPFTINEDDSEFQQHQLVRLQVPPERADGQTDASIDVALTGDLVNNVRPGDRVTVDAQLQRDRVSSDDERPLYEYVAEAHDATVEETDFEDIDVSEEQREAIETIAGDQPIETLVGSFAPSLHGLEDEKLSIILSLFGGQRKELPDGSIERGDSHVLFVGDPGVGKTALLNFAADIAPRSIKTDGKGSTSAGLTAAAVRDDFGGGSEWTLEGGSLVKANNGVCCIDELDDMEPEDRASLHTALEDQEVRVSKAGISATLPAKTTVIAAANPTYGRFDPYEPIAEQIDLKPTLFSRFDLIFTLQDQVNPDRDAQVVAHKLDAAEAAQRAARDEDVPDDLAQEVAPTIDKGLFRAYIAHARQSCTPRLTDEAKDCISEAFLELRQMNNGADDEVKPVPVTYRDSEAITRLAEASARIRLSDEVLAQDVDRAVKLIRRCMEDVGMDPETGEFDADMIETGTSRRDDRIKSRVKKTIRALQDDTEFGADETEVVETATDSDISEENVVAAIDELRKNGEIYSNKKGYYRLT